MSNRRKATGRREPQVRRKGAQTKAPLSNNGRRGGGRTSASGFSGSEDTTANTKQIPTINEPGIRGLVMLKQSFLFAGETDDFGALDFEILESNSPLHPTGCVRRDLFSLNLAFGKAKALAKGIYNAFNNTFIDDFPPAEHDPALNELFIGLEAQAEGVPTDKNAGLLAQFSTRTHTTKTGQDITVYDWRPVSEATYQQHADAVAEHRDPQDAMALVFGVYDEVVDEPEVYEAESGTEYDDEEEDAATGW